MTSKEYEDEGDRIYREAMEREERDQELDHIYHNELGFCGCGRPDDIKILIRDFIKIQKDYRSDVIDHATKTLLVQKLFEQTPQDVMLEFFLNVFNNSEIMDHGSSVYGSKLTDKGERFYNLLDEYVNEILEQRK